MTTTQDLKAVLPVAAKPKSAVDLIQDGYARRVFALAAAVNRTKTAMDGEVGDDLAVKVDAWRKAVQSWNELPYEIAESIREAKRASEEER